ncbi:MAG: hypothetical protein QF719_02050 [Chloroflexota bacterium]|jgi:multiple sugar transport system permease protein|nr:hypothetical protein [Chloroflexota bacterium]
MGTTSASSGPRRRWFGTDNRGSTAGFLFVLPSILFLIIFVILPIVASFYYSLTDYDLMRAPRFVGMKN